MNDEELLENFKKRAIEECLIGSGDDGFYVEQVVNYFDLLYKQKPMILTILNEARELEIDRIKKMCDAEIQRMAHEEIQIPTGLGIQPLNGHYRRKEYKKEIRRLLNFILKDGKPEPKIPKTPRKPKKNVKCISCGKKFISKSASKQHFKDVHEGKK